MTTLRAIAGALAQGIAPDPVVDPVVWATRNLIVADGPGSGQKYDIGLAPYAAAILHEVGPTSTTNRVSVRKSAQVGLTQVGIAWLGSIIDTAPTTAMVVFPTISAVQDFNRDKLQPTIEATPCLRRKVREQRSRSAQGSTKLSKRFPGGAIVLTGANSAADLRSKTVQKLLCDEIDEWPLDLDGQGDPMKMADARQTAFHASGDYQKLEFSTPTIKGSSRIDAAFEAGDQRFWFVPCPHCGEYQRLLFSNLKFERQYPYNARYGCSHCGALIEEHYKRRMVSAGRWQATCPGAGRHPSFHIDAMCSLLTTWDKLAEAWWESKDDPRKLKTFLNLWLGEAWEERGDAPEWQRLFSRREDYALRTIPHGGLLITGGADVQKNGIYYEVIAWGAGKTSWSIDIGFLPGDTADRYSGAWLLLDDLRDRQYPDAYGNVWAIDAFAVDSGFNTAAVYGWVRGRPRTFAVDGRPGWFLPPIGTPKKQDIDYRGKKKRRGLELWPVGTWPLKSELYANLRKKGRADGESFDPPGFCHFSLSHDDRYFQQLVAEYVKDREVKSKGVVVKEWVATGENHYLDCRVYAMAMAEHLGVSRMKDEDWMRLAEVRAVPPEKVQADLFSRLMPVPPAKPVAEPKPQKPEGARPQFMPKRNNFLKR